MANNYQMDKIRIKMRGAYNYCVLQIDSVVDKKKTFNRSVITFIYRHRSVYRQSLLYPHFSLQQLFFQQLFIYRY